MLTRFGWLIVLIMSLWLVLVTAAGLSFAVWTTEYSGNCEATYWIFHLTQGVCPTNNIDRQYDLQNCWAFNDDEKWNAAHEASG